MENRVFSGFSKGVWKKGSENRLILSVLRSLSRSSFNCETYGVEV
jgi:hypothetical protein